jgi:hypothetical protein
VDKSPPDAVFMQNPTAYVDLVITNMIKANNAGREARADYDALVRVMNRQARDELRKRLQHDTVRITWDDKPWDTQVADIALFSSPKEPPVKVWYEPL